MKNLFLLFLIFSSGLIFSQGLPLGSPIAIPNALDGNKFNFFAANHSRVDYARIVISEKKPEIKGTVYAFKEWNNRGLLKVDGRNFKLNYLNFNMYTSTIEAKVGKDSVYIFDLANVEYAAINNRKFKSYYFSNKRKNEIFELLYDGKDFKFIKGYEVGIKKPVVDPAMVRKPIAKYFTTETYYIKRGINIKEINLKKKNILSLFGDETKQVIAFVKKNNLSYKNDQDLNRMFTYYNSL